MEAIILAGGFGTRLKEVVSAVPKPLAPISNKPFLYWLIKYLQQQGVTKFIFSLGYLHNLIETFLIKEFSNLHFKSIIEKEPLGTGGAIKLCMSSCDSDDVLVINGDSFFELNIPDFFKFYKTNNAKAAISLKPMKNFDRYGTVVVNKENIVTAFNEKMKCDEGLINAGILIFNKKTFLNVTSKLPQNFSYEKDFLESNISSLKVSGFVEDGYFIDIGIPEDFYKAQEQIPNLFNQ